MNSLVIVFLVAAIALSNASVLSWGHGAATLVGPGAPGVALQGPASHAALIGPDGSHISASAQAGALVVASRPGGVVSAAVTPGVIAHGGVLAAPALVFGGHATGLGYGHADLLGAGLWGHGW